MSSPDSLSKLPAELHLSIADYLESDDILRLLKVNRYFSKLLIVPLYARIAKNCNTRRWLDHESILGRLIVHDQGQILRRLIAHGLNISHPMGVKIRSQPSLMLMAVCYLSQSVVELLIEHGHSTRSMLHELIIQPMDSEGESMLRLLLKHDDVDAMYYGFTAFKEASFRRKRHMGRVLLEAGANPGTDDLVWLNPSDTSVHIPVRCGIR